MPHRDNLEAALQRAQALEKELTVCKETQAQQEHELAACRRVLAQQDEELVRLRGELGQKQAATERQKADASTRKKRHAPDQKRQGGSSWLAQHQKAVIFTCLFVGLVVSIPLCIFGHRHHQIRSAAGARIRDAHLVTNEQGKRGMIIVGEMEFPDEDGPVSYWRLDVVDLQSGQRVARRAIDERMLVLSAGPGKVWCLSERSKQLQLLDAWSLASLATAAELTQLFPQLTAGVYGRVEVDRWSGGAIVNTMQGAQLFIDSTTLKSRPFAYKQEVVGLSGRRLSLAAIRHFLPDALKVTSQGPNSIYLDNEVEYRMKQQLLKIPDLVALGESKPGAMGSLERGGASFFFRSTVGGARQSLHIRDRQNQDQPLAGGDTLLKPSFIVDYHTARALELPGDGGSVVLHRKTLDTHQERMYFSQISWRGKIGWTVTEPYGSVRAAILEGPALILAVETLEKKGSYILAVDWRSGKVLWLYET